VEREKGEKKNLTAPLTLVLSRMGREENKKEFDRIPSPLPSPTAGRGKKKKKMKRFKQ
jgi:hypothetical protein